MVVLLIDTGIQFMLLKSGLLPDEVKKFSSTHVFFIIVIQAVAYISVSAFLINLLKFEYFKIGDEVKGKDLLFGFAGLFGVNLLSAVFLNAVGVQPDQFKEFDKELLQSNVYLFMFTIAFFGPIYEEFIFRGVILGMLCYKETSKIKTIIAVIFSSLLFMLVHFDDVSQNFLIGVPLFILGLYFSYWALRKKGIMLTIILHMSQNLLAGLALLSATK